MTTFLYIMFALGFRGEKARRVPWNVRSKRAVGCPIVALVLGDPLCLHTQSAGKSQEPCFAASN